MRTLQAILLLIFLGAVGIFGVQNTKPLTVEFLNWRLTSSVALLIVAVYFLGMLSGWFVVGFVSHSLRRVAERPRDRTTSA